MGAFLMLEYFFHVTRRETFPKASRDFPHSFLATGACGFDSEGANN